MAASDLVNLSGLMDDAKCFAFVRQRRWPEGIRCPGCDNDAVTRDGHDDAQPCRQRYRCKACSGRFDDLTGTVLAGHHQPLRVWVLCLYFMGLNVSNRQIALELGLDASDVQAMTEQLRHGRLSQNWGSGGDRHWQVRVVGWQELLSEAGTERAIVDGAPNLQQQIGAASRPAHLL